MPGRVVIRGEGVEILVELDGEVVPEELFRRLPQESKARIGSGEIRVPILVPAAAEPADREEVETGDVAYLPEYNSLCLFFDVGENHRDPEVVTRIGRIVKGIEDCRSVRAHQALRLEAAQQ